MKRKTIIFFTSGMFMSAEEVKRVNNIKNEGLDVIVKNGAIKSQFMPEHPICGQIPEQFLTPKGKPIKGLTLYKEQPVEEDDNDLDDDDNKQDDGADKQEIDEDNKE